MAQDDKLALLAVLVATTINVTREYGGNNEAQMRTGDRYAEAAGLDLAALWTPGVETFGRMRKAGMLVVLRDECGAAAADSCAKMKRDDLARCIGERLPQHWLPEPMRPLPARVEPQNAVEVEIENDENETV